MLALRRASSWAALLTLHAAVEAYGQAPPAAPAARPLVKPATATATGVPAAAAPGTAKPATGAATPAAAAPGTAKPAAATATATATPAAPSAGATGTPAAPGGTPTPAPGDAAAANPATPPPAGIGTVAGQLLLSGGAVPKYGVVYLEGVPAGSWTPPRERIALSLRGARIAPEFFVVVSGQTVQVPNDDRLIHSLFSLSAARPFDLGHMPAGETRTLTFDKPGVVNIYCNIHDVMQALAVVVPSTFYAVAGSSGNFQISGVPAGKYRLVGYSPQAGQLSQPVEVRAKERTNAKLQFGQSGPGHEPEKHK